jgi:predicted nucleic acid-binding protein
VRTFFDSSAFAKRYIDEPGSLEVDSLCMGATELALSVVCIPEIISALSRRMRERKLSRPSYEEAKRRLSADVEDAVIVNLTSPVISTSIAILEAGPVRALDAIHIACAVAWEAGLFVSADKQQLAAARKAGLRTRAV